METEKPWHNLSVERVLKRLETSENGLTENEAARRLKEFGLNKLPEKKRKTRLLILLNQFKSPLVYLLFAGSESASRKKEHAFYGNGNRPRPGQGDCRRSRIEHGNRKNRRRHSGNWRG